MSDTPICDFVKEYIAKKPVRFHMPGHKGKPFLGFEKFDLTEIDGADSLFEASGIIAESEKNASVLFGCPTFYSTEGSSLCVRAMLYLAASRGRGKTVLAARNVHKSFLYAAALLDLDVRWLPSGASLLSVFCTPDDVASALDALPEKPCCLFLTSPDYLGGMCDLRAIARVCRARGVLLLVDCAHGAYLRFLEPSLFPVDLGADLVCSSAHKTLPVLTGGAYLHVGKSVSDEFCPRVKDALALFASTSPSYLILQSLDAANPCLKTYKERLSAFLPRVRAANDRLASRFPVGAPGAPLREPMKLTLAPKPSGYSGDELAAALVARGVCPEFHDPDFLVLMPSPENRKNDLIKLEKILLALPERVPLASAPPPTPRPERVLGVRDALMAPSVRLPADACAGRILADPCVSCPPAVPVLMCGERIDEEALAAFRYYGVTTLSVVR